MSGRGSLLVEHAELPAGVRAVPVRTRLVRPNDDLIGLLAAALRGIAFPGDVVTVSETALAIAQGEFVVAEHIRPSKLAYVLCRFAGPMATISQPESLQLVIERVGAWRVVSATVLGVLGRAVGRRGVFYELLGEAIAAVDGYTGTMPPYERAIVLSPREPNAFATESAIDLGLRARSSMPTTWALRRYSAARRTCCSATSKPRCSPTRPATATNRRRSSY